MIDRNPLHLHPAFRAKLDVLMAAAAKELPSLGVYEGARSPQRQQALYAIGRQVGEIGHTVTRAMPWQSLHQYGMAADLVWVAAPGRWTWEEPRPGAWARYTELAAASGLRTLSFERPHVELPVSLADLQRGIYPSPDANLSPWRSWLVEQIEGWHQSGSAPPLPTERPRIT